MTITAPFPINPEVIYEAWERGDLTDSEAQRQLLAAHTYTKNIAQMQQTIHSYIEHITRRTGATSLDGYALAFTSDGVTVSWDTKKLDSLIARLVKDGDVIAQEIAAARRETPRAGGLRIAREKAR